MDILTSDASVTSATWLVPPMVATRSLKVRATSSANASNSFQKTVTVMAETSYRIKFILGSAEPPPEGLQLSLFGLLGELKLIGGGGAPFDPLLPFGQQNVSFSLG